MIPKVMNDPRHKHDGQIYVPVDHTADGIPRYLHRDGIVRGSQYDGEEPSGFFATMKDVRAAIHKYQARQAEMTK